MKKTGSCLGNDPWLPIRMTTTLPLAAVITFGLLWGMQRLIITEDVRLEPVLPGVSLDFIRLKPAAPSETPRRVRPQRPPPAQKPPPEPPFPEMQPLNADKATIPIGTPRIASEINLNNAGFSISTGDGDYLPIFKVAPNYPQQALRRGIEGYCIVQYTITRQGSVRDVQVLEDQCTHTIFREPSLHAAKKFKYKPRTFNGTPMEVTEVHNRFVYRLEQAR